MTEEKLLSPLCSPGTRWTACLTLLYLSACCLSAQHCTTCTSPDCMWQTGIWCHLTRMHVERTPWHICPWCLIKYLTTLYTFKCSLNVLFALLPREKQGKRKRFVISWCILDNDTICHQIKVTQWWLSIRPIDEGIAISMYLQYDDMGVLSYCSCKVNISYCCSCYWQKWSWL